MFSELSNRLPHKIRPSPLVNIGDFPLAEVSVSFTLLPWRLPFGEAIIFLSPAPILRLPEAFECAPQG